MRVRISYFCGGGVDVGCDTVPGDCAGGSDPQFEFAVVPDGIVDDALVDPVVLGVDPVVLVEVEL